MKIALAIVAHPDDIEIMMAGTLLTLKKKGYEIHYMTLSDGDCGSQIYSAIECGEIRTQEAQNAADTLGAVFHQSITHDMEIFYTSDMIKKIMAVIRLVNPDIILTHALEEYMFDHAICAQLVISAAFAKGAPNYTSIPSVEAVNKACRIYHSLPYGLRDMYGRTVKPDFLVNIVGVMTDKILALECHISQREWLKASQGQDDFVETMQEMCRSIAQIKGSLSFAEGWIRHSFLGFCPKEFDPMCDIEEFVLEVCDD